MFSRKPNYEACLLAIGLILLSSSQTCQASQDCDYSLKQKHGFNGNQRLCVGKNMWRLDNPDLGYTVVANDVSGKITVFSVKKKLRFDAPLKDFNCQTVKLFKIAAGESLNEMKWNRIGKRELPDTGKTTCFQATETRTCFRGSQSGGFLSGSKYQVKVKYTVWISDDILVSKQLSRILAEFQGTPDLGGVPVKRITEYSDRDKPTINLETTLIGRERLSAVTWKTPALFSSAHKLADVINTTDESVLQDLIGN